MIMTAAAVSLKAQYIEDALRYNQPNGMITPRVASMGVSYYGLVDDAGAMLYNPAGMSLIRKDELSVGLGFSVNSSEVKYLDKMTDLSTNDEYLTHISMIVPFDMDDSKACIGIGYFLESNFENNTDYRAFNTESSYISDYAANSSWLAEDNNMMIRLWLADKNLKTPITGSLAQAASITETGGLHNLTGSISFDIDKNVFIGASITGKWGTYGYRREFVEADTANIYNYYDSLNWSSIDLTDFTLNENLTQEVAGITGSIGVVGVIGSFMRVSANIKFPTFYEITETFSQNASARFDDGTRTTFNSDGETSYNVRTPFVYGAGVSFHAAGLTFSAGVEYSDASQIEFTDATDEVEALNENIIRDLVGQTTWGFGAEYKLPWLPAEVRASYTSTTSPYAKDIPNATVKYFALGAGVYLSNSVRLDGVFRWMDHSESLNGYFSGSKAGDFTLTRTPLNIGFQLVYRY